MVNSPPNSSEPEPSNDRDRAAHRHFLLNQGVPDLSKNDDRDVWLDRLFSGVVWLFSLSVILALVLMMLVIAEKAAPSIREFGLKFIWQDEWNVFEDQFGALTYIHGTLITSTIALLLAVPVGLSVAIVTTEDFFPGWLRSLIGFIVELLAAIPSVIVGLWGIFVMLDALQPVQEGLHKALGPIPIIGPLFSTQPFGPSMLAAGLILAIMVLPTIAAISREVLLVVPKELRSASMSLGATRWETIFGVILPAGFAGIVGGVTLALGRALGETMAVTMVIGNSTQIVASLLAPGNTIPAVLANEFPEAGEGLHLGSLMYLALILFLLTLVVNVVAELIIRTFTPNME